jgi:hypothetical protein
MPIVKLKDGSVVEVQDMPTPERLRELGATLVGGASRGPSAVNPNGPNAAGVERSYQARKKAGGGSFSGNVASSMTFGLTDKFDAAAGAIVDMGRAAGGDKSAAGGFMANYDKHKRAIKRTNNDYSTEHPVASGAGAIAGLLMSPLGASTGVAKGLTRGAAMIGPRATKALQTARGSTLGLRAGRAGNSAVGLGARAGLNNGLVNGALNPNEGQSRTDSALAQGAAGAVFGGGMAGALKGGSALHRAWGDHQPKNAAHVAYDRIGGMIERAPRFGKIRHTPRSAEGSLAAQHKLGEDPILADLSDEMTAARAYLGVRPRLDNANEIQVQAKDRVFSQDARLNKRINDAFPDGLPDGHEAKKAINEARKLHGEATYTDEVLDRPFQWNDDMDKFFTKGNPLVKDAMKHAEHLVRADDLDPKALGWKFDVEGNLQFEKVPSMRTMQYVSQGFNTATGAAMKAGDKNLARLYSKQHSQLKDAIGRENPEFLAANAGQKDFYQEAESVQLGQDFVKNARSNARQYLDDMKSGKTQKDELITGVRDALINMKGNRIAALRTLMKDPHAREALKYALNGSSKELNKFDRFLRRELTRNEADRMVTSGSKTHALGAQGEEGVGGAAGQVAKKTLTGGAFGGPIGAVSGLLRGYDALNRDVSRPAQEKIAELLMGRGEGVSKGVREAAVKTAERKAWSREMSRRAGRLGAGVIRD